MSTTPGFLEESTALRSSKRERSPLRTLAILVGSIFLAEVVSMIILYFVHIDNYLADSLLDGLLIVLLTLPGLYLLQFNPLLKEINERTQVEQALQKAHDQLEIRVQERTQELAQANQSLQEEILISEKLKADLVRSVDELKIAQDQLLKQNEELYRLAAIVETSEDGIIGFTLDSVITSWNSGAERIYGYFAQEAIGRPISFLASPELPNDQPQLLERVRQGESIQHYETTRLRRDGRLIQVSLSVSPVLDPNGTVTGGATIAHDITQRKEAEAALLEAYNELGTRVQERTLDLGKAIAELHAEITERKRVEEQLRVQTTALQAAANGIFITDAQGNVQWSNPAFTQLTGYTADSILGRNPRFLKSGKQDNEYYKRMWDTILSGQVWRSEVVNRRSDGALIFVEQTITPVLDESGQVAYFIAIQQDITERKQAEERIRERNQKLEELYRAERNARRTAETLRSASLALTQTLDLEMVTRTLLKYIARLIPYNRASVILYEDNTRLKVWAMSGYGRLAGPHKVLPEIFNPQTNPHIQSMIISPQVIYLPDTADETGWVTHPELTEARSWLGVPLVAGGRLIGLCELNQAKAGAFTQENIRSVEALAVQSAVVIQNAWLFEQVRAGRERLQALSHQLVETQENERRYIARELHDEAGQMLASLMIGLDLLEREAGDPQAVVAGIAELNRLVDTVLDNLHRLAIDLRPASLDHLGLVAALRQQIESLSEKHKLMFNFQTAGVGERLPVEIETALYRIAQEAITNILRHAHATRVDILLEQRKEQVVLMVEDNGTGFDSTRERQPEKLGLFGMRERAEMLGGSLAIESSTGSGTTLFVEVPYAYPDPGRG